MKRLISILLIVTLLISALPSITFAVWAEEFSALVESTGEYVEEENNNPYQGKVVSILGASTCTFDGYIPVADGFNLTHVARYPQDNLLTDVNDTWWMQVINALDAKLGINDSWRSTEVYNACADEVNSDYDGTKACLSSLTRIQNLGSNGTPDIIFAFCGINDIIQGRPLSDFDSSAVLETVDLISETWTSVTDAYVAMIMRLQYFYPDAELVVLLPTYTNSYSDTRLAEYNAVYKTICEHFGVRCLDVRESLLGIEHMPDGIHPNAEGMTYLADFILDNILPNCEMEAGENIVYTVTHDLNNAAASHSYYKGISAGKTFCETLSGENLTVTVTMGGKDITDSAYNNGEINIASVTDNIVINASAKFSLGDRLQHIPQNVCGGTNLWATLEPMNEYYTASGWGNNAAGTNYSVTFPIKAGDRLWATCFGTTAANGFAENGARITWFGENGVLQSVARDKVYAEFAENGYITAPEEAVAVSIPMASDADTWEIYLLGLPHSYTSAITDPTPDVQGYSTYICTVCGDSYIAEYTDFDGFDSYEDAVKYVRAQMVARQETIHVRINGMQMTDSDAAKLCKDAWAHTGIPNEGDYIRWNRSGTTYEYMIGEDANGVYTEVTLTTVWFTTAEQEAEVDAAVEAVLAELSLDGKTDYEKIRAVYDYVCTTVVYDHDNLYDHGYLLKHSAYAALIHKKAVCQGFALLFYRLCLEVGIDARVITGYTDENHAWNIVRLDDKYYNMDPTGDRGTGSYYRYFLTTIYTLGGYDRDDEFETDEFNAAYPMATLPYVFKVTASGTLSNGMEWIIDGDTGVLTVTGKGAIPAFRQWNAPWVEYADSITGIVLSEGITTVGDRAFAWCNKASSLTLPSTLKVICEYGFNNCRGLTTVDLPEGLTTLDFCAFSECSGLKKIVIPGSVTSFGSNIFSNCPNITEVTFAEGLTHIPDSMFASSGLTKVTFPSTLVSIGDTAFADCDNLKNVTLPAHVTKLGYAVFSRCNSLTAFAVDPDNPTYTAVGGVLFSKDKKTLITFPAGRWPDYGRYIVPDGTEIIGEAAFYEANKISSIVFPDSLTVIDEYAFAFCKNLYSVNFGPNITSLGDTAFGFCTGMYEVSFANPKTRIDNYCFTHCTQLWKFEIPSQIPEISPGILTDCHSIKSITIPSTVSTIGSGAFQFCKSLTSVTIPANIKRLDNCAFFNCTGLKEVTIEGDLTFIDWSAFDTCTELQYVRFCGTVGSVANTYEREIFRDCPNIKAVYFDKLETANKIMSATSFGGLCANAMTIAVPQGATGLNSFLTNGRSYRSNITLDGVAFTLYSSHNCWWSQQGDTTYVGCETRVPYDCYYGCHAKKQAVTVSHSYSAVTTPATCTQNGATVYTCHSCGDSYSVVLPATGHTYDWYVQDATCTEDGWIEYYCGYCGDFYTEILPATGHSMGAWYSVVETTCLNSGTDKRDCDYCDYSETRTTDALGHDLVAHSAKSPTCIEIGWDAYETCSRCDHTTYAELPALGHDLVKHDAKTPTCLEIGWNTYETCSRCDYTTYAELPALGHDLETHSAKTPTCLEIGWNTYETCSRCDYTTYAELSALGHDLVTHSAKAPTCLEIGWNAYETCSRCDYTTYVELPALGHDWVKHDAKAPTCVGIGWNAYETCSRCDYTTYAELPALGHALIKHEAKAPTCLEIGWNAYETCSRCDYTTYAELPALGHALIKHEAKAPTCLEIGWDAYDTCSRCDYTTYAELSALGHDLVTHSAKAPTCLEIGWNAYETCSRCDYTTYAELPALGHDLVKHEAKTPSCLEIGWNTHETCTRCDYTTYAELPALGHDLETHSAKTPTCLDIGWNAYETCSRCDFTTYAELPALGHDLETHSAKTPTCLEIGWNAYETCSRCDYTTYAELSALGHDLVTHSAKAPTCLEIGWNAYETCSRCDYTTYVELPALGHDLNKHEAKAPTCLEIGWNAYETCSRCDYTTYAELPALGHDLIQHNAKSPTCLEIGWNAYETCSRCDYTTYAELPALGHDLSNHEAKAPTCLEIGWNAYETCSRCDHTTYAELPALGHDLIKHDAKAPTCLEIGWNAYETCSRCDHTTYAELPALGHALIQHNAKAPTCLAIGWNAYETCSRCDYTTYVELPALGHDLIKHEAKAPTCLDKGWNTYETCSRCDYTTYAELPALGHDLIKHEAKAPTCLEIGWNAYETCSRCDHTTYAELPALGHDLIKHNAKTPSCLVIGWNAYETCSRCDYTTYVELPALGHIEKSHTVLPTCTQNGYKVIYCDTCGTVLSRETLDAYGHDYVHGKCTVCGEINFLYGDANGDGMIDGKDVTRLLNYLSWIDPDTGRSSVEVAWGADVNGDESIDGRDATRLLRYLASLDPITGESAVVPGP